MSSIFTSRTKKTIVIGEGDDAVSFVIRKLSGRSLETAQQARAARALQAVRHMGGDVAKAFRDVEAAAPTTDEAPADLETKRQERYAAYDRDSVLTAGVDSINPMPTRASGTQMSKDEAIADLDLEARRRLHEEIVDLSCGPIDPVEAAGIPKGA